MPNHYSDMGFVIEKQEDVHELLNSIYERGETINSKNGDYCYIVIDEHIEFWLQLKRNSVLGLEFHYSSENITSVRFEEYIKDKNASKLGGVVHVWNGETFVLTIVYPFRCAKSPLSLNCPSIDSSC